MYDRNYRPAPFTHALLFLLLAVAGCQKASPPRLWSIEGPTMGSTFKVILADADQKLAAPPDLNQLNTQVQELLRAINRQMSTYDPKSEISQFNQSTSTDPLPISPMFAEVVALALDVHAASRGAFDITILPLVEVWGFGPAEPRTTPPTDAEIAAAKETIGSQHLVLTREPPTLAKKIPRLKIDLNAIAPGYAADQIGLICERLGYANYLVDVGGEFRARGKNGIGQPWRVAVERPQRADVPVQVPYRVLALTDQAVATSGDYRQYFEHAGRFYSHTIDPRTGRPIEHDLASISVITQSAAHADAWATALNVLGPEEGIALLNELPQLQALFLVRQPKGTFEERKTQGIEAILSEP